jgi:hypothetical protein
MQRRFDRVIALGPILGVLGCSDPVPNSNSVGLTLNLSQTGSCPITPGVADDIGDPPPDSTRGSVGKRVFDGEGSVSVRCMVKAAGSGAFSITAAVSSESPAVSISIQNGTMEANGMGTARMGVSATALPAHVSSPADSTCSLDAVPDGDGFNVKPGAVWMRFNCPALVSAPAYSCRIGGEIVLENCSK